MAYDNKQYRHEYYLANKELYLERQRKYRLENSERVKEKQRSYMATEEGKLASNKRNLKYRSNSTEKYLLSKLLTRCRKYRIACDLTLEDVKIPEVCPYLQQPLTRIHGKGKQDFNPSIDRIDHTKGYIKGNIQIISFKANRMKNDASLQELVMFANSILTLHKGT